MNNSKHEKVGFANLFSERKVMLVRGFNHYFLICVFLLFSSTVIIGCQDQNAAEGQSDAVRKVSTKDEKTDQSVANQAKKRLLQKEEVTEVRGANSKKDLVLAVQVEHMDRFRLKDIEKKSKEQLKKEFPGYSIEISTDQKIFWELDKLEKQLQHKNVSSKKLNKKLNNIKQLMKEKP
ncbi:YhcN/YlaJ family sporulation lipoprotein [Bacillus sp. JJ675]|uniref:YhcN/YlaJ family sporulation lipoprotein n=1 Tax=Bacillus sp. JJ675 TaxID=3122972 RepID=UPI002FFEE5BA